VGHGVPLEVVQQTLPHESLEKPWVGQLLAGGKGTIIKNHPGGWIGIPVLSAFERLTQEHGLACVQVPGPGRVDDIERPVEIGAPDFPLFGFDSTALVCS